jgi:RNA polymerase sigma-70 factor (ECF subfamily)
MSEVSDKLLESAKMGDIVAYEQLTSVYYKKIYNMVLYYCGENKNVTSIAQEIFVKVYLTIVNTDETMPLPVLLMKTASQVCKREGAILDGQEKSPGCRR